MALSVGVAAKKALEVLASNKKGRKFLGYVIGITLFLIFLPVVVLFGFFGWMSGGENMAALDQEAIIGSLPEDYQEQIIKADRACDMIELVFKGKWISQEDINKAQGIYLSCLVGKEEDNDTFYTDYADCFLDANENLSVFINIALTYNVSFSAQDIKYFNKLYGGTE